MEYLSWAEVRFNSAELWNIADSAINGSFHELRARAWVADHLRLSVQAVVFYLVSIVVLMLWMRNRKPYDLALPMNFWNGFLALFSLFLTVGMAPEFFHTVLHKGINASVCDGRSFFSGHNGFLVWLFHLSKIFELVDTYFIILRKRPLIFLHWYHHALTLYFCWYEYPAANAFTRWGIFLNSAVHSIMYGYYFVKSIGVPVPKSIARSITSIQIIQFVIAFWSLWHTTVLAYIIERPCDIDLDVFLFSWLIDLSYLLLFVHFYFRSYVWNKKKAVTAPEKDKTQ